MTNDTSDFGHTPDDDRLADAWGPRQGHTPVWEAKPQPASGIFQTQPGAQPITPARVAGPDEIISWQSLDALRAALDASEPAADESGRVLTPKQEAQYDAIFSTSADLDIEPAAVADVKAAEDRAEFYTNRAVSNVYAAATSEARAIADAKVAELRGELVANMRALARRIENVYALADGENGGAE